MARELDAEVAEKVFLAPMALVVGNVLIPDYSIDIQDAFMVVAKMRERGLYFDLRSTPDGKWASTFGPSVNGIAHFEVATTAPEAICRAALAALKSTEAK